MALTKLKNDRLSFLGKRWNIRNTVDDSDVIGELTKRLLSSRGMTDDEAAVFLDPGLHRLHDPFLFPEMENAVARLLKAISDRETIALFGDYDADGQTGTALLKRVLTDVGARVMTYIPNRIEEGYGLNIDALSALKSRGATVVITVDCGITNVDEAAWAKDNGLCLIITDHHLPPDTLPPAVAIINPRTAPEYPFSELAGCGVAFKLGEAIGERTGKGREIAHRYVDLVAVGTVADVVSLTGENRSLVRAGLLKLNQKEGVPGLTALSHVAGIRNEIKAGHLAFQIGPRLNAAGRISDPSVGVRLLTAKTLEDALRDAHILESENDERRRIEEEIIGQAELEVIRGFDREEDRGIVVAGNDWHPGVIGIVASRIVEANYRPTIVFSIDGETAKGSGRSVPGFNLYDALAETSDLFDQFGGHAAAAGITIKTDRLDLFRERFLQITKDKISDDDLIPALLIDTDACLSELTMDQVESMSHIEPFGIGNPSPVLLCTDVHVDARIFGKDGSHLRMTVGDKERNVACEAVAFRLASELSEPIKSYPAFDVAFTPEINEWNGVRKVQLIVKDIRPASPGGSAEVRHNETPAIPADLASVSVVDERGSRPVDVLNSLLEDGRSVYLPIYADNIALTLTQQLQNTSPLTSERVITPANLSSAQTLFDNPPWVVMTPGKISSSSPFSPMLREAMARVDLTYAVYSVPPDPSQFAHELRLLAPFSGNLNMVLLFGDEEGMQLRKAVREMYPDRETLRMIYKTYDTSGGDFGDNAERESVVKSLTAQGYEVTDQTITAALEIFMQVGLIYKSNRGYAIRPNPPKVDLTDAVRYNIGVKIKSGLDDYIALIHSCQPDNFVRKLSSYIEGRPTFWPV